MQIEIINMLFLLLLLQLLIISESRPFSGVINENQLLIRNYDFFPDFITRRSSVFTRFPKEGVYLNIKYKFMDGVTTDQRDAARVAIRDINDALICNNPWDEWYERSGSEVVPSRDTVYFFNFPRCMAFRGRRYIGIGINDDCLQKGILLHLMMHLMGMGHEHQRRNRDGFIKVHWHNIRHLHRPFGRIPSIPFGRDDGGVSVDESGVRSLAAIPPDLETDQVEVEEELTDEEEKEYELEASQLTDVEIDALADTEGVPTQEERDELLDMIEEKFDKMGNSTENSETSNDGVAAMPAGLAANMPGKHPGRKRLWFHYSKIRHRRMYEFDTPYDFSSIMHWHPRDYARMRREVFHERRPDFINEYYTGEPEMMGQRVGLSDEDKRRLNLMYSCSLQAPAITTTTVATAIEETSTEEAPIVSIANGAFDSFLPLGDPGGAIDGFVPLGDPAGAFDGFVPLENQPAFVAAAQATASSITTSKTTAKVEEATSTTLEPVFTAPKTTTTPKQQQTFPVL